MIEDIEELSSEAGLPARESKLPLTCDIRLKGSKATQHFESEIALSSSWWSGEGRAVEDLAARISRTAAICRNVLSSRPERIEENTAEKGTVRSLLAAG